MVAGELRSDIAMVMREIDAGGTAFRAAIEAGDEELEREVLAALESLGAEFGDMAFMLSDLARAAREIQDSLSGQDPELRAARERAARQSADVRMIREELAVIERACQWQPEPAGPSAPVPRWDAGCPYRGPPPYDQAHRWYSAAGAADRGAGGHLAGTGIVMSTGALFALASYLAAAGSTGARARPRRAGARVAGLARRQPHRDLAAAHRPGRRAGAAGRPGSGRRRSGWPTRRARRTC